jgi:uncharacterized protein (TIGR00369 family)
VPDDRFIVTSYMHVDVLRTIDADAELIVRDGRIVAVGVDGVTCAGEIVDASRGDVVAMTTGRFASIPVAGRSAGAVQADRPAPAPGAAPSAAGDLSQFLGLEELRVDGSVATYTIEASECLSNERGGLHGGSGGLVGEYVAVAALRSARPDVSYRCVESRAVYLRPVAADGGRLQCTATVLQSGRTQAVVTVAVLDGEGRTAVETSSVFARA